MTKKTFIIEDLCCAHCASKIEEKVRGLEGVVSANLNFIAQKLVIEAEDSVLPSLFQSVKDITARIEPDASVEEA